MLVVVSFICFVIVILRKFYICDLFVYWVMVRQVLQRQQLSRSGKGILSKRTPSRRFDVFVSKPMSLEEKKNIIGSELSIDPNVFNVEFYPSGLVKRVVGKPVEYDRVRDFRSKKIASGDTVTKGAYVPFEFLFDPSGNAVKKVVRDVYLKNVSSGGKVKVRDIFVKQNVNYMTGEFSEFKTRGFSSGRETVRLSFKRDITGQERFFDFADKIKKEKEETTSKVIIEPVKEKKTIVESERERRENALFEAQARSRLTRLINEGKVIPGKSGIVSIGVAGKRFRFKIDDKKVVNDAEKLRKAQKFADQIVGRGEYKVGQSFEIDGFVFKVGEVKPKVGTTGGLISPIVEKAPEGFIAQGREKLDEFKKANQIKAGLVPGGTQKVGQFERTIRGSVVLGTIGAAKGVLGVIELGTNPVKVIKDLGLALSPKNFKTTLKGVATDLTIDPAGTIAEFYSFSKTLNLLAKGVKRSPVGKFVQEEAFIASMPKELKKPVRAILKSSKVQAAINPTNLKNLNKVDLAEVKSLTSTEAGALKKTLQTTDSVVFGSAAGRTLSGKTKTKLPLPKDVDIATSNIVNFNKVFLSNLPKSIKKNYRLKGQKIIRLSNGEAILDIKPLSRLIPERSLFTKKGSLPVAGFVKEVKIVGKAREILEASKKVKILEKKVKASSNVDFISKNIKKIESLKSKIRKLKVNVKLSDFGKLDRKIIQDALDVSTQKLVKVEGIKLVGFGEQTLRKALGTLQVLIEKNVRRAKDPQSFVTSLQIQVENLRLSKPRTIVGKLRNKRRVKILNNAIDVLTSKQFSKLLDKKVPGLTKEYPILSKISVSKLKNTKKLSIKKIKDIISKRKKKSVVRIKSKSKEIKKVIVKRKSKLKRPKSSSLIPKRIKGKKVPASRLPRKRVSKVPSKLVRKRQSRLPKKRPSVSPSKLARSKRSGLVLKGVSRLPKVKVSKLPKAKVSKLPSRLPKKKRASKFPIGRKRVMKAVKAEKRLDKEINKEFDKVLRDAKRNRKFIFLADLESLISGKRAKSSERKRLLMKGRIFTGLERRPIV